jgi:hypothetical protein
MDEQINEILRELVRRDILNGWRTYTWHQRWWTVCPAVGACLPDMSRSEALDYVREMADEHGIEGAP